LLDHDYQKWPRDAFQTKLMNYFGRFDARFGNSHERGWRRYATNDHSRELSLLPIDAFVDIGSGKGRVYIVARMRLARATGIEYSTSLTAIARRNIKR
jgi:SAM-dependent methyltransferase